MKPLLITALALFSAPLCADEVGPDYLTGLRDLAPETVVILGEAHDNARHHETQAEALRHLSPSAVVFEMLDEAEAEVANGPFDSAADMAAALNWEESGWPDFALYQPVFEAVRGYGGAAISGPPPVIYGAEVTRDVARAAIEQGAAAVFGPDAARFGLDQPLPEAEQAAREQGQQEAHCGMLPEAMLGGFVEAQRLRDARLAVAVLQALEDTGGPVAVITGNGHARVDWGVPSMLSHAAPELTVLSIGQLEAQADEAPFDVWLVAPPPERDDPCAAFAN